MNPLLVISMALWFGVFSVYLGFCAYSIKLDGHLPLWTYPGRYILIVLIVVTLKVLSAILLYPVYLLLGG